MYKIIVVDDDLTNTKLIQMLLELDGFKVVTCAEVDEAIEKAEIDTDAFVVDFHLARGTTGLELLTAIRNGETAASTDAAVIITSGDYRREIEADQAGADLFLSKPYSPNVISQEIRKLVARDK